MPPYIPSWGSVIANGRDFIRDAPWLTLAPGLCIGLTVTALNIVGDTVRDLLDPKLRGLV